MATNHYYIGNYDNVTQAVAAADVGVFHLRPEKKTGVSISDAATGTCVVEYTRSEKSDVLGGTAKWHAMSISPVGAGLAADAVLDVGVTAVRASPSAAGTTVTLRQAAP